MHKHFESTMEQEIYKQYYCQSLCLELKSIQGKNYYNTQTRNLNLPRLNFLNISN
jgi:hypothetical protein